MTTINGYVLITPWTTAGGGRCKWAKATKGGATWFLKAFLSPKHPVATTPGGSTVRAAMAKASEAFAQRQRRLLERLSDLGNHIIGSKADFFLEGTTWYKATPWVEQDGLSPEAVRALPHDHQVTVMASIAHSLAACHGKGVVHGDLKLDNVLLRRNASGVIVAKLIDLDDAWLVDDVPAREHLVHDPTWFAPETALYLTDLTGEARPPGSAADCFTYGLLIHAYLRRSPLRAPSAPDLALGLAIANGHGPDFTDWADSPWGRLLPDLLNSEPERRPTMAQVLERLARIRDPKARESVAMEVVAPVLDPGTGSRLRGRLVASVPLSSVPAPAPLVSEEVVAAPVADPGTGSRLRGRMVAADPPPPAHAPAPRSSVAKGAPVVAPTAPAPTYEGPSRLRGSLLRR